MAFAYTGTDDFTGNAYAFNLEGVTTDDGMVSATLVTADGSCDIAEHINEDGSIERVDSNIRFNLIDDVAKLFPCERPSLAPRADYVPLAAIYSALQAKL